MPSSTSAEGPTTRIVEVASAIPTNTPPVLSDSVVNSGKTVVSFVQHIHSLHATIQIVIVTGVVLASQFLRAASPRHSPITQISALLHFASLTVSSLTAALQTLVTVSLIRHIYLDSVS